MGRTQSPVPLFGGYRGSYPGGEAAGRCHTPPLGARLRKSVGKDPLPIYLLSYLLTLYSRVLLEKLKYYQPVEKFPAFYGTPRFITAVASARHQPLS